MPKWESPLFYCRKINAFYFILSPLEKFLNYSEKNFFFIFSEIQAAYLPSKTLIDQAFAHSIKFLDNKGVWGQKRNLFNRMPNFIPKCYF